MTRTAQEIAREALAAPGGNTWSEDAEAYSVALQKIAALPDSAPFALPVDEASSVRVSAVDAVDRLSDGRAALIRYAQDGDVVNLEIAKPPYAAAWLALFGVPPKEEKPNV